MTDSERIPTNLRTLLILEILGKSDRAMTATEINETLQLPKQTVHRLCATLEENGFLVRRGTSRKFQVARRLREMGAGLLYNSRDHIFRHQILETVSQTVGESVNYVVPEETGMRYLDRVETDWAFRIQLPVGTRVPFHCSASGKCFLASLGPTARKRMVSSLILEARTETSHVTTKGLLDELALIARDGFALDREEFMTGMVAIAVPVTDRRGRFIAALAYHGPTPRMTITDSIAQVGFLKESARRLGDALFDANVPC
ncbi:IclR family transcriptional regulator [uncultured Shimia sp.]|uniref:IclR family transcriptional regulator n=1 Tax=uncultured Shimia sp. TaxID=573152 RepID=UPI00262C255C|nr:IclR family transcriptional regulator [uncultured Shimia sp.]